MTWKSIRPAEVFGNIADALLCVYGIRIIFLKRSLEREIRLQGGKPMSWTKNKDHLEPSLNNQMIQMGVNKINTRTRSPMTEKARLNIFRLKFFIKKKIILKIDLGRGKIICRAYILCYRFNRIIHDLVLINFYCNNRNRVK